MGENPQNIIRSWNVQGSFQTGPTVYNKLEPPEFGKIKYLYVQTWREIQLDSTWNWGAKQVTFNFPEAIRVISSMYLKIKLPALSSGVYKKYPGLYAIKDIRLLSGGNEIYTCNYTQFLADHCQSMKQECVKVFGETYLGHQSVMDGSAREILCPILLPNSAYLDRNGFDTRGHGIWPGYYGPNKLEIQVTLNEATFLAADAANYPGSIVGACSMMFHEVKCNSNTEAGLADLRGAYSIVNRRFTELTSGWQHYDTANSIGTWNINQPQGVVTEVMLLAVADNADESRHTVQYIKPTSFKIIADSQVQKDLDDSTKVNIELWTNGFCPPEDFPCPGRLCFASHTNGSVHIYKGGYNMRLASTITYEFSFAQAVRYKIIAVQLQRVHIDDMGRIIASLDG